MQLPKALLHSLKEVAGFNEESFTAVHDANEQVTSIRANPAKSISVSHFPSAVTAVPWAQAGYYLDKRPSFTFDPLFHAGCYYVQEASSMFLEQALKQTIDLTQPLNVLDLSAAPGGKSTHIQSLISADSLLVSNEVIKARASILKQNIIKWGGTNVIVTNSDPQHFQKLESFFDVIVVDAPCSGSGLFRKDEGAIKEWSPDAVAMCSGRQQRILADVLPALKEGGILIYSTCSYSVQENEDVSDWLVEELGMHNVELIVPHEWGVVASFSKRGAAGYRFYPDKLKGEGFFLSCFRKKDGAAKKFKFSKPALAGTRDKAIILPLLKEHGQLEILKHGSVFYAFPQSLLSLLSIIQSALYIQYAGTTIGELMRDKLVPDHAFALSNLVSATVERTEVDYKTAIRYLQRQEITLSTQKRGWQLVTFQNQPLGWINALPNRINNYYPKELRILKEFYD